MFKKEVFDVERGEKSDDGLGSYGRSGYGLNGGIVLRLASLDPALRFDSATGQIKSRADLQYVSLKGEILMPLFPYVDFYATSGWFFNERLMGEYSKQLMEGKNIRFAVILNQTVYLSAGISFTEPGLEHRLPGIYESHSWVEEFTLGFKISKNHGLKVGFRNNKGTDDPFQLIPSGQSYFTSYELLF